MNESSEQQTRVEPSAATLLLSANGERVVAILGGGDWYDASIEHLMVPHDVVLKAVYEEWRLWYRNDYMPQLRDDSRDDPVYISFSRWLQIHHGAREAESTEVEEFDDR